jgi:hypothetical protein
MAPQNKPMPTSASMRSPLDPRYTEAMSNLYKGIKKAAAQGIYSKTDVKRNFDQFKRITRVLFSQGDNFIIPIIEENDPNTLSDPQVAKEVSTKIFGQLSGDPAQKAMNYAPGIIEGHHPVAVESIFEAGKHLINAGKWDDYFEYLRTLNNEYGIGGTVAESMYPLSRFAHQWKGGRKSGPSPIPSAHTTANPRTLAESTGFPVEMNWGKTDDFSDITDPRKLADVFMERSGFPQMMMADKAMDSPQETAIRNELASLLGIRERELYSLSKNFETRGPRFKKLFEEKGITNDTIQEIVYRNYGLPLPERKPIPSKDPNAPKVTKTTKPAVIPTFAEAEQFAKGWFTESDFLPEQGTTLAPSPAVTRSQSLGRTAAAIANREPVPTPKPQPKVGQPAILNGKPVIWSGGKWMPVPAPKAKLKDTPNITPNPKPAPRVIPTKPKAAAKPPVRVIPARTQTRTQGVPRNQESASMQIRRLQNSTPDALFIYPGMGLPSNTLPGI